MSAIRNPKGLFRHIREGTKKGGPVPGLRRAIGSIEPNDGDKALTLTNHFQTVTPYPRQFHKAALVLLKLCMYKSPVLT